MVSPVLYTHVQFCIVVGASGNFSNAEKLINDVRKLESKLEAVVQEDATRASPKGENTG